MIRTIRKNWVYLLLLSVMTTACGKEKGAEPEEKLPDQAQNTLKVRVDAKNREVKGSNVEALFSRDEHGTLLVVAVKFEDGDDNLLFTLRAPEKSKSYQFDTDRNDGSSTIGYSIASDPINQFWLAPLSDLNNHGQTIGTLTVNEFDTVKNTFNATFSVQAYNLRQNTKKTFTNGEIDVVFLNISK